MTRTVLVGLTVLGIAGCLTEPETASISGTWNGTEGLRHGATPLEWTFELTDEAGSVTGTHVVINQETGYSGTGTIAGTYDHPAISLTITTRNSHVVCGYAGTVGDDRIFMSGVSVCAGGSVSFGSSPLTFSKQ